MEAFALTLFFHNELTQIFVPLNLAVDAPRSMSNLLAIR
jgi:hypothetical protein